MGVVSLDLQQTDAGQGSLNYEDLGNKPKINGVTLVGDLSTEDINIFIPERLSELQNDAGYVTKNATDLVSYYTKTEVDNMISTIPKFSIKVVEALPTEDISTTTIYLLPADGGEYFEEYIYVDGNWERLGSSDIDLSDYATYEYVDSELEDKANIADLSTVALSGRYSDLINTPTNLSQFTNDVGFITSSSLPTKTSDLVNDSGFISEEDYASANTAGVVKVGSGLSISANGVLSASGGGGEEHPYTSLERLRSYLYKISFENVPQYEEGGFTPAGCSSLVEGGKLYRNLDWYYDESPSFIVECDGFIGMATDRRITDNALDDSLLAQLPYHLVDGINESGIMVSTHVLYNDWGWERSGSGTVPIMTVPYQIMNLVHSMASIGTDLAGVISNLSAEAIYDTGYLLQFLISDGTTTYALLPPTTENGSYALANITSNPKLTNFRWVEHETVVRNAAYMQTRPTGVERWNEMTADFEALRFTLAYEAPTRLSEFIGLRHTDKDSTDAQLESIYNDAHAMYLERERDGSLWQTMHSVVYSSAGMEKLYVQEDWERDYAGKGGSDGDMLASDYDPDSTVLDAGGIVGYVDGVLPTKTSDLTNDSGFITKDVSDLTNYYDETAIDSMFDALSIPTKTSDLTNDSDFVNSTQVGVALAAYTYPSQELYTQSDIDTMLAQISSLRIEIVNSLPQTGVANTIYLLRVQQQGGDIYQEYFWINNAWELIGDVDLTNYYTKAEINTLLTAKADVSAIPTKTSDLTNDSSFVADASYVHTDNNYTTAEKNKLAGISAGAEVNVQSDWGQTNSSADDFIKNKPSIPTKTSDLTNDSGFITVAAIPTNVSAFNNDAGYLDEVPDDSVGLNQLDSTVVNALNNINNKADTADLAAVAFSGAYDDLTGTPTIPTVNNATLTIQKNGANVQTFTANQATNATANITVPTKTSDLTNDSGFIDTVDSALNTTSTNPVQNKVVAQAINDANALIDNKISYGDVQTSDIANGAVTTVKIANDAVTNEKIADGEITQDKFDLDEFPAGRNGYYFTSNKTTTNSTTGTDLGNPITITVSVTTRVMFEYSAVMRTSTNTSNVCLKIDNAVVDSSGTNGTSFQTIIGHYVATLAPGSHTIVVAIRSQNASTTATAQSYTSTTNGLTWWCV